MNSLSNIFSAFLFELEKTRRDNPKENPTTAMGRLGFPVITLILRGQSVTAQERTDGFSSNLHLYERISGN
ncbi:hypothetical protein, partial [Microcystis aeruginosa]|uniref:hypothetical protein n=1 Tax=Microcystis aeruginosa TaxID=1126 RepID=UPI001C0EE22E